MIERWLVLVYLLVCVVVGALATRRVLGSADEYWVAGRRVGTGVNALAIMASLASGGSLVGVLGLAYSGGIPATLALFAGAVVGFPLATILVAAPLRRLAKFTITDFMVFRYPHGLVRALVPTIIVISLTVYMVAQMKAAGITAEALLGVDYGTAITVATVVFVLYVSFGGMVAVTVTDVMQGALLFLLMGVTAVVLAMNAGSPLGSLQAATAASPAFGQLPAGGFRLSRLLRDLGLRDSSDPAHRHAGRHRPGPEKRPALAQSRDRHVRRDDPLGDPADRPGGHPGVPRADRSGRGLPAHHRRELPSPLPRARGGGGPGRGDVHHRRLPTGGEFSGRPRPARRLPGAERASARRPFARLGATWLVGAAALYWAWSPPELLTQFYTAGVGLLSAGLFVPVVFGLWWRRANLLGGLAALVAGVGTYSFVLLFGPGFGIGLGPILVALPVSLLAMLAGGLWGRADPSDRARAVERLHQPG